MRAVMKTTVKKKEETKEGSALKELFVLWSKTSKAGQTYLSGKLSDEKENVYLIGYYNTTKKNPNEPDIRIYNLDEEGKQDHVVCSLWNSESKNKTEYLSGVTDENEKVVGFYGDRENSARPLIRVYIEEK